MSADERQPSQSGSKPAPHPGLKLALKLGPLIIFFVTFSIAGIYWATGVFMVTSVSSVLFTWVTQHRVPIMPLITAVLVLVLGGLTIYLQNDTFIKLKLTVINGLFGTVLLGGVLMGKPLIKHVFGETLKLADRGWQLMSYLWIAYFYFVAALNEAVWRNVDLTTWVRFKTFAIPVLTLVFFLAISPVIAKYDLSEETES